MRPWIPTWIAAMGLVTVCPCEAGTPGIDLTWGTCATTGASYDQGFACDTNDAGSPFLLVMTFRSDQAIPEFVAASLTLDVCTISTAGLPDWWGLGAGECRDGSFVFPAPTSGLGGSCVDLWAGHPVIGNFSIEPKTPGRIRINMDIATTDTLQVLPGVRYVVGAAAIDQRHATAGDGTCSGCAEPVNITLLSVELFGYPTDHEVIAVQDTHQWVTWQGGWVEFLCLPDPTHTSTWGAVKTLYR